MLTWKTIKICAHCKGFYGDGCKCGFRGYYKAGFLFDSLFHFLKSMVIGYKYVREIRKKEEENEN